MNTQKTVWDVVSDFGKWGIVSVVALMLVLWAAIHFMAESGKTVEFAFWSYTKPLDARSKSEQVLQQLSFSFSLAGLNVTYGKNACSDINIHDMENASFVFDIKKTDLYINTDDGTIVLSTKDGETSFTPNSDELEVWDGDRLVVFLNSVYQNVKTHCLGGVVAPLTVTENSIWIKDL